MLVIPFFPFDFVLFEIVLSFKPEQSSDKRWIIGLSPEIDEFWLKVSDLNREGFLNLVRPSRTNMNFERLGISS